MSKFKVGDRVRTVKCTCTYAPDCEHRDLVGKVFTITKDDGSDQWQYSLNDSNAFGWDDEELELVTKGEEKMGRRTFRLLKDTYMVKKGALVQEQCDDGDQDFEVLDKSYCKFDWADGTEGYQVAREAVLNSPQWFEEVFNPGDTWFTKAELEAFKAFVKSSKPKRPAKRSR